MIAGRAAPNAGSSLRPGWILSPRADTIAFSGSLLLGLAIIAIFAAFGRLDEDVPPWLFVVLVAGVDVAHVYATAFRVYLDPARFRRRPVLFLGVPLALLCVGQLLWSLGPDVFWRALAYLAVFHFVRQQWGWVAYTRRRADEGDVDLALDRAVTYTSMLFPLLVWHIQTPRAFDWFLSGDFVSLAALGDLGLVVGGATWIAAHLAFGLRQLAHLRSRRGVNGAKIQVLATTSISWFTAIVVFDSDIAFTALNVLGHGVPYLVVVWHVEARVARTARTPCARLFRPGVGPALLFVGLLALLGYGEEWLWHQFVWLDQLEVFPGPFAGDGSDGPAQALTWLVPLLALPQATHYLLDGWLWRVRQNPDVGVLFEGADQGPDLRRG